MMGVPRLSFRRTVDRAHDRTTPEAPIKHVRRDHTLAFEWTDTEPTCSTPYLTPILLAWLREARTSQVLDLGCGNGALSGLMSRAGFDVVGLDASESGIRLACQAAPNATFVRAWLDQPLQAEFKGAFDAVVSCEVIEHLLRPQDICDRAKEALKDGGRLLVTTPYHGYLKNLALAVADRFDQHWEAARVGGHVKFFSRATLFDLLQREGFRPARCARVGRLPVLAKSMVVEAFMTANCE
jgi:2-polyprenyl-3-methyl-5-hydroxy-6-metoxy-1,4-benzoquinol methylase